MDAEKNTREIRFILAPARTNIAGMLAVIAAGFTVNKTCEECEQQTVFDAYDRRLLNKNFTLVKCGRIYNLISLADDSLQSSMVWDKKRDLKYRRDILKTELSKKLSRILGNRALVPLFSLNLRTSSFTLESNAKQTVSLTFLEYSLPENTSVALPAMICLQSSRLNKKQLKAMCSSIPPEALQKGGGMWRTLIDTALKAAGIQVVPDETAYLKFTPDATIKSATVSILKLQLDSLRYNEKGIIADIDSECLHDFRVALRKMRVALSELKEVFPEDRIAPFMHEFDELGTITNQLRDHDVFMEQKERLLKILSPAMRPALLNFFKTMQRRRRRQFLALIAIISSSKYLSMITAWEKFLNGADKLPATEKSENSVLPGVAGIILKRLGRVIDKGLAVKTSSPDSVVHKVRIQCKKLRYLLDFFYSVLPDGKTGRVIRDLKRIQTLLGDFNDFSVQIRNMEIRLHKLTSGKTAIENAAAFGAIIAALSKEKAETRARFQKAFTKFSSRETINPLESFLIKNQP
ncbi:MAG: CHAD domain-containing protein [Victivallaceae bacterium]